MLLLLGTLGPVMAQSEEEEVRPASAATRRVNLPGGVVIEAPETLSEQELEGMIVRFAEEVKQRPKVVEAAHPKVEEARPLIEQAAEGVPEGADQVVSEPEAPSVVKTRLPSTLLWTPPLASRTEPRLYVAASSLSHPDMKSVNDFGIGGTLGIQRWSPQDSPDEGVQLDLFVLAITRFAMLDAMDAVDYRVGVPLTFAWGNWTGKLAYEHTSSHLGDEFIEDTGARTRDGVKEEIVFGLSYYPREELRVYGQIAHAMHLSTFTPDASKQRYGAGIEWSDPEPSGRLGAPFAALGLEYRGEAEHTPNITFQAGWQWRGEGRRQALRVGVELYDGRSPFMQFIDRHESWVALLVAGDF
jgi:hypothetical protein